MSASGMSAEQEACLRLDRATTVSAGAGSGKTRVLVERYIRALAAEGGDVDRVLLVTFTEKAAAELRLKARRRLVELSAEASQSGAEDDARRWRGYAARLGEAWIGTIHGVARRFAAAAGPGRGEPPPAHVLEGAASDALRRGAVALTLDRIADGGGTDGETAALRRLLLSYDRAGLLHALSSMLQDRERAARYTAFVLGHDDDALTAAIARAAVAEVAVTGRLRDRAFARIASEGPDAPSARLLSARLAAFLATNPVFGKRPSAGKALPGAVAALLGAVAAGDPTAVVVAAEPFGKLLSATAPKTFDTVQSFAFKALRSAATDLFADVPEVFTPPAKRSPSPATSTGNEGPVLDDATSDDADSSHGIDLDRGTLEADRDAAVLMRAAAEVVARRLSASDSVDFDGMIATVDRLLDDPAAAEDFSRRFRHVLVDEFQDTDARQWSLFRRLFGGATIVRPGLCLVGDAKQAIYAFRGGDVAVFRGASAATEAARTSVGEPIGERRILQDNYRSTAGLVAFVNAVQRRIFPDEATAEPYEAPPQAMRSRRDLATAPPSRIEVHELPSTKDAAGDDDGDGESADRAYDEALVAALRLRAWRDEGLPVYDERARRLRPFTFGDAAVLLRTRTSLPALERAFLAAAIPLRVASGVGFYERPEVVAPIRLLAFLADAHDDAALLDVLRSPFFALPDSVLLAARDPRSAGGAAASGTLYEGLVAAAARAAADPATLPTPGDAPALVSAVAVLARWRSLSSGLPAHETLAAAIAEQDYLAVCTAEDPSGRSVANVERLLNDMRRTAAAGDVGPEAAIRLLNESVAEAEAAEQADPPGDDDVVLVLTEHAAKGLEWPVVVLVGVGQDPSKQPSDSGPRFVRLEGTDGVLATFPYRVIAAGHERSRSRNGSDSKSLLDAVGVSRRDRERTAEQMRLFYVALTRARDHLVLVGGAPADATRPRTRLGLLDAAVAADVVSFGEGPGRATFERVSAVRPRALAPPPAAPWRRPEPLPLRRPPPPPPTPFVSIPADAARTFVACPRRVFLERVIGAKPETGTEVATGVGGAVAAGGRAERVDPRVKGSVLHAAFEAHALGRDAGNRARDAAFELGVSDADQAAELATLATDAVARFVATPAGARLSAAPPGGVFTEVPLTTGAGGVRLLGRADLLIVDAAGALVIDYKTSGRRAADVEVLRALAEEAGYAAQVEVYAAAVRRGLGVETEAALYFTDSGILVPIVDGEGRPGTKTALAAEEEWARRVAAVGATASEAFPLTKDPAHCRTCPHRSSGACLGTA